MGNSTVIYAYFMIVKTCLYPLLIILFVVILDINFKDIKKGAQTAPYNYTQMIVNCTFRFSTYFVSVLKISFLLMCVL